MKTSISILATTAFLLFFLTGLSAQEEMKAKKYDNPQWQRVVFVDYYAGKAGKADAIIKNYFAKAAEMAGTPGPSLVLEMNTGQYDRMLIWNLQDGVESLNWDISPNNVKWRKAFVKIAGSEEKADAINDEYRSYVRSGKSELARKLN